MFYVQIICEHCTLVYLPILTVPISNGLFISIFLILIFSRKLSVGRLVFASITVGNVVLSIILKSA